MTIHKILQDFLSLKRASIMFVCEINFHAKGFLMDHSLRYFFSKFGQ